MAKQARKISKSEAKAPDAPAATQPRSPEAEAAEGAADYIGHVVSVTGSEALVVVDGPENDEGRARVQMGNLVRLPTKTGTVYGIVSGLMVPVPRQKPSDQELFVSQVDLVGEAEEMEDGTPVFAEGVSGYPALGDPVHIANADDLRLVFGHRRSPTAHIGTLHQDAGVSAELTVDDLLGKHFAILGNTGTGKSCAATVVLRSTLDKLDNGHVLVLDPHNEYSRSLEDKADVLDVSSLDLPYWLLNGDELKEVIILPDSKYRDDEAAILADIVPEAKRRFSRGIEKARGNVTLDTPVPYRLADFYRILDDAMGRLDKGRDVSPYQRIKIRFKALQSDGRYGFMFKGLSIRDNLAQILAQLFSIPVSGKPATVVDLSGVPSEILNVVVSLMCRLTFDFGFWSDQAVPVLLVCEEAHRYAPRDPSLGFKPATRAIARIAKEGRKYGISLCVISQRPSELDLSVLSQCNTVFALRTTNQADQDFVQAAISECGTSLLQFLPSLRTGEAIVTGDAAKVPMRVMFDELDEQWLPRSKTAKFSDAWTRDTRILSLDKMVARWRDNS